MKPLQIFVQTYRPAHWRDKASWIHAYSWQSGRQLYRIAALSADPAQVAKLEPL